jgi:tRNA pseudouridine55 synthase
MTSAFVIINKEKDYTSHDVVAIVKKTVRLKAGHTGTLDPQAEGVLTVCLGGATRLAGFFANDTKEYIAEGVLGTVTDTYDITGVVLEKKPVSFDEELIRETVKRFIGRQEQQPPMYSAVKVNGKKLYQLAREGKTVERAAREIFISDIQIETLSPASNTFTVRVNCSKGTYIRSLCADIGAALGCGACMGALVRTRSGRFVVDDAVKLGLFKQNPQAYFLSAEAVLPFSRAYVIPENEKRALNGNPLADSMLSFAEPGHERYWVYGGERLVGLYRQEQDRFVPEVMMV